MRGKRGICRKKVGREVKFRGVTLEPEVLRGTQRGVIGLFLGKGEC